MKIRLRKRKKKTAPFLFDADFYRTKYEVTEKPSELWSHFCTVGHRRGFDPNPVFSTNYYRKQYLDNDVEVNPLLHYIETGCLTANPHPFFDAQLYLSQLGNVTVNVPLLEHFLRYNDQNRFSPSVFFNTNKYLFANPEVSPCGFVGLYHYIRFGEMQGRKHFIDPDHISTIIHSERRLDYDFMAESPQPICRFLSGVLRLDLAKPTVVLAANRAETRFTELLHKVSCELSETYDANMVHVFGEDLEGSDSFSAYGPQHCLDWGSVAEYDHEYNLNCAIEILRNLNALKIVYFDSAPDRTFDALAESGIPIQTVVPSCDENEVVQTVKKVADRCDSIQIQSRFQLVAESFDADVQNKVGYYSTNFESVLDKTDTEPTTEYLRQQMGISPDTQLVVGSGPIGFKGGFDRFVSVACTALDQSEVPVQFLWVGTLNQTDAQAISMLDELKKSNAREHVLICNDHSIAADAFAAADTLLLTHRSIAEAPPLNEFVEAGRPIVWFEGHGLVDRALEDSHGKVTAGNVQQAVRAIELLASDANHRNEVLEQCTKRKEKALSVDGFTKSLVDSILQASVDAASKSIHKDEPQHILKMPTFVRNSKKNRRVIFTSPNWQISGVNTFIETLVNELNKLDYEATVLFTTTNPLGQQKGMLPNMPYVTLTQTPNIHPKHRRKLLHQYLKAMAPCVFVPSYDYNASTLTPELQDNIATLGVLHSDDPQHYVHGYRMGPYWDQIVSVSSLIEDKLLELNASFTNKSSVIRYGIRDEKRTIPERNSKSSRLRVIYTGRIIQQQKLIFDFVKVAEHLAPYKDDIQLVFVGDGPDFGEFQKQMAPHVQSGLVDLMGRVTPDQISEILHSGHVFALTSEFEGLPLSMLEALSAGLVPVVTDVESGIGEVCRHGENSLISPIGNPEALAENLMKLARSPELFNQLSKAARNTFLSERLRAVDMAEQYSVVLDRMFDHICDASSERTDKLIYCPYIERLLNVA